MKALRWRSMPSIQGVTWKGRRGVRLANGAVEVIVLTSGGHLASLRCPHGDGASANLLWEAPWRTIEPHTFHPSKDAAEYGTPPVGPFLAGFTGHALSVPFFGGPSPAEAAAGHPLHGEAACVRWKRLAAKEDGAGAALRLGAKLPLSQLSIERELRVRRSEPVVYVAERLTNEQRNDRVLQWVQHATFGPPLLAAGESATFLPGERATTWPHGYEGKAALPDDLMFRWPRARTAAGKAMDLSRPFSTPHTGFVVGVQLDRRHDVAFVAVLNWRLGLAAGYCFRRRDFPWVAVWEENRARPYKPWNGVTQARGLEFGSTAMPVGLRASVERGPIFNTPTVAHLGAQETREVHYLAFATAVPKQWRSLRVRAEAGGLFLEGGKPGQRKLLASDEGSFLA